MNTGLHLLIIVSVIAGFFMRPLNMFVFGKVASLLSYTNRKAFMILILLASMLSTFTVTISAIYLSLKLTGFIPLGEQTPTFVISIFLGGVLWVIYAKLFNRECRIDL